MKVGSYLRLSCHIKILLFFFAKTKLEYVGKGLQKRSKQLEKKVLQYVK